LESKVFTRMKKEAYFLKDLEWLAALRKWINSIKLWKIRQKIFMNNFSKCI
jgi:hypothetical protein